VIQIFLLSTLWTSGHGATNSMTIYPVIALFFKRTRLQPKCSFSFGFASDTNLLSKYIMDNGASTNYELNTQ
jgi:hypothetical protein